MIKNVIVWASDLELPKFYLNDHMSTIRAMAFCPWQRNLLITGGFEGDQTLRVFNTYTGLLLNSVKMKGPCFNVIWSKITKELVISIESVRDRLFVYSYPDLKVVGTMPGHDPRSQYMCISPNGEFVCTAGGDQNVKVD